MYERYENLRIARDGSILTVTIDNPPLNTLTPGLRRELSTIFADINSDEETSVVVLAGSGNVFSAGGNIVKLANRLDTPEQALHWLAAVPESRDIIYGLLDLKRPIIAQVNGPAVGFGATIALYCDIIIASEEAKFADPHVKIGLVAGDGGALIWPQHIGFARAKEYVLTGRDLPAHTAAEIGLINHAVPRTELEKTVRKLAGELAALPKAAVSGSKVAMNMALRRGFDGLVEAHLGLEALSASTEDHKEAVRAARDKRRPEFTGR